MQKATMKILFDDIGTNIKQFNDVELKLLGLIIESTVMMWCNNLHSLDENPYHRAENRCQLTLKKPTDKQ